MTYTAVGLTMTFWHPIIETRMLTRNYSFKLEANHFMLRTEQREESVCPGGSTSKGKR